MRKTLRIAKREYKASVRTKGFIIAIVLAPVMMSGSIIAMILFQGKVDTADKHIAVIDHSNLVTETLVKSAEERNAAVVWDEEKGKKVKPSYYLEIIDPDTADMAALRMQQSNRVRAHQLQGFVEIGPAVLFPGSDPANGRIVYHAENAPIDEVRGWLNGTINNHLRHLRLTNAGVQPEEVGSLLTWISVEGQGLVSVDSKTGEVKEAQSSSEIEVVLAPIFTLILMFLMMMMGAIPLLQAVMEEKNLRIAEVLLGSVRPFQFMMGKIVGGVAVSLTALTVYVVLGAFVVVRFDLADKIPYHILPWFYTYMIVAIVMVGSGLAALGSTCNDAKDAQNLTFPAMLPILIPMFLMIPVIEAPNSSFATGLSLFPPFTPMLMLLRMSSPVTIPGWQPWVGLAGILLLSFFSIWLGGRIFRVGILVQGQAPKLSLLLRWAFRG
ncbi:ABC transporter permease [Candidatus Neomarinimicrobiota bacterium]